MFEAIIAILVIAGLILSELDRWIVVALIVAITAISLAFILR